MTEPDSAALPLAAFDYELPEELIAQRPLDRGLSRLLVLDHGGRSLLDRTVRQLPELLEPGDLLVINDTRVIPARLHARRVDVANGGRVEVLLVEPCSEPHRWAVMAKPSRRLRPGVRLSFGAGEIEAVVAGRDQSLVLLDFDRDIEPHLDRIGEMPLPPYIRRPAEPADRERYQTVYARDPGAVAAPTAGLHFDSELMEELDRRGIETARITLHVGLGTFRPVSEDKIENHAMHRERFEVPDATVEAISQAQRVVAVGTTVVRALESAALDGTLRTMAGSTDLFIRPGFDFRVVDILLTNFHLPRSTLLMMVSAFAGHRKVMGAYQEAVRRGYRFFSYGDAMLLERKTAD